MYKLTRPSGFDFYSGTVNYRAALGTIVRVTDCDPPEQGPCGRGLHASRNPNYCFVGAKIPCAAFRVKGIQPIAKSQQKTRYQALKVLEEIHDLDALLGWKYSEAANPVRPFEIDPPEIKEDHVRLLKEWTLALDSGTPPMWNSVRGSMRGSMMGSAPPSVRDSALDSVATFVATSTLASTLASIRTSMRDPAWYSAWNSVWSSVRSCMWAYVSSLFPNVKKWERVDHAPGANPFQSGVDLWRMGLVPSYDGKLWRLHGGPNGRILWQGEEP